MNMIVNASDLVISEAESNKLKKAASRDAVSKLVKIWESKQAKKAKTLGGFGLMAVSLAACNSSSDDTTATTTTTTTTTDTTPTVTALSSALTTGADNSLAMTSGDDTITGTDTTLTSGDIVVDLTSTDNDTLTVTGAQFINAISSEGATVSGVENVNINFSSLTAGTFQADGVYNTTLTVDQVLDGGATTVTADDVNAGVTVKAGSSVTQLTVNGNGIADDTSITIDGGTATTVIGLATDGAAAQTAAGDVTITAGSATTIDASGEVIVVSANAATSIDLQGTSQTDDSATITSDGATTIRVGQDLDGNGAQITENITLSGGTAALVATVSDAVEKITATGSQNVTVKADGAVVSTEELIDSSTATTTLDLTNIGADADLSKAAFDVIQITDAALGGGRELSLADGATVDLGVDLSHAVDLNLDDDDTTTTTTTGTVNVTASKDITTAGITVDTTGDAFSAITFTPTVAQTGFIMNIGNTIDATLSGSVAVVLTNASTAKSVNASAMTGALTATTTANMLSVTGGSAGDTVTIHAGAVTVDTGAGNDTVTIPNITMNASSNIQGGTGTDTLNFTGASTTVGTIDGFEIIATGNANHTIASAHIANKVMLISGTGTLTVGTINTAAVDMSNVTGSGAFTTVINANANIGSLLGAGTSFALTGTAKVDTITGNAGADTIIGGDSGDTLDGGAGDDHITAGEGTDTIKSGTGNDTIVLTETTAAADNFEAAHSGAANVDTITGFNVGTVDDTIDLTIGNIAGTATHTLANMQGADIAAGIAAGGFTALSVATAASATSVTAANAVNLLVFTTAASTYAAAIGENTIVDTAGGNTAGISTTEGVAAVFYDTDTSEAVYGYIVDDAGAGLTKTDTFHEIVRVSMTTTDYTEANIDASILAS